MGDPWGIPSSGFHQDSQSSFSMGGPAHACKEPWLMSPQESWASTLSLQIAPVLGFPIFNRTAESLIGLMM
jgi:hypothetical protein